MSRPARRKKTKDHLSGPLRAKIRKMLLSARVARLATFSRRTGPCAVPVCFVYCEGFLYTPIDRKPKNSAPERLVRVRNIRATARVALLIDHYEENWSKLWFLLVRGKAKILARPAKSEQASVHGALRRKYPQYAAGMLGDDAILIRITPGRFAFWQARR
jgi:PPOX class probable F420-dependent enzyme